MCERFPRFWRWGQGMFLIFPLLPTWGALGLLFIAGAIIQQNLRAVLKRPLNWGLVVLTLWLVITSLTAEYPQEAWLGMANFVPFFVVFMGWSHFIQTPNQLRRLAWLALGSAVPIAVLGIGQIVFNWTTPQVLRPLLGWVLVANGNPSGRLASVFMYANIASVYLLVMFTIALGLWVEAYRWRKWQFWQLLGLTGIVFLIAIALVLTSSRNAWGVAFLVTLSFVVYLKWYQLLGLIGILVTTILGAAFAPTPINLWLRRIVPPYFWARLNDQMYSDRASEALRLTQWQFSWELIQERPFLGWGLRNFTPLYEEQMGIWLGHPHNLPLMLSAEIGLPGTLFLFLVIGSAIVQAILLLSIWSTLTPTPGSEQWQQDKLIFFTFLVAFLAISSFNLLDVSLFDLRMNLLSWFLLAAISGVSYHYRQLRFGAKLIR